MLTVIGDPSLNRTQFFLRAARAMGVAAESLPYARFLDSAAAWPAQPDHALLKLESPGRDFALHCHLLKRGHAVGVEASYASWPKDLLLPGQEDPGLILGTRQWYLGWKHLLEELSVRARHAGATFLNDPVEIADMFDKTACHDRLRRTGVQVPDATPEVHSFAELESVLEDKRWQRVFLKTSHGSAANGVVALAWHQGRVRAQTAVELAGAPAGNTRLYSTRRLRVYDERADVQHLVDTLCRERVHVERWIPKAGVSGQTMDVRIVVIGGRACHFVLRLADGPITNLPLGATKGTEEDLARVAGAAAVDRLRHTAESAAACYPGSLSVGVDLALTPDFRHTYVLEVNAFGDLLENWSWQGADTYTWQVRELLARKAA